MMKKILETAAIFAVALFFAGYACTAELEQ